MPQLKKDICSNIIKGLSKMPGSANSINADELLDNIFCNNGKNFMLKRLKKMGG